MNSFAHNLVGERHAVRVSGLLRQSCAGRLTPSRTRGNGLNIVPAGTPAYLADSLSVVARGIVYSSADLDVAIDQRVRHLVFDETGRAELQTLLATLPTTQFQEAALRNVLQSSQDIEDWRVGEALAEAFLSDHCACFFPWPSGRDVRNPSASPAGTDLVGFEVRDGVTRFAFGEVKTSQQESWPPQVMYGRHGLINQLETLRDSVDAKNWLVRYLGLHSIGKAWEQRLKAAAERYLRDSNDVALFGFLVRDVDPNVADLDARARALGTTCPAATTVSLRAVYLPSQHISLLVAKINGPSSTSQS